MYLQVLFNTWQPEEEADSRPCSFFTVIVWAYSVNIIVVFYYLLLFIFILIVLCKFSNGFTCRQFMIVGFFFIFFTWKRQKGTITQFKSRVQLCRSAMCSLWFNTSPQSSMNNDNLFVQFGRYDSLTRAICQNDWHEQVLRAAKQTCLLFFCQSFGKLTVLLRALGAVDIVWSTRGNIPQSWFCIQDQQAGTGLIF